jgi:hypothetical protein
MKAHKERAMKHPVESTARALHLPFHLRLKVSVNKSYHVRLDTSDRIDSSRVTKRAESYKVVHDIPVTSDTVRFMRLQVSFFFHLPRLSFCPSAPAKKS